jgi:hypothetical protein
MTFNDILQSKELADFLQLFGGTLTSSSKQLNKGTLQIEKSPFKYLIISNGYIRRFETSTNYRGNPYTVSIILRRPSDLKPNDDIYLTGLKIITDHVIMNNKRRDYLESGNQEKDRTSKINSYRDISKQKIIMLLFLDSKIKNIIWQQPRSIGESDISIILHGDWNKALGWIIGHLKDFEAR